MGKFEIKIDSVTGGIAPALSVGRRNQFQNSIGIDPDFPVSDSEKVVSGLIRPVSYEDFSGANIDSDVVALFNTPDNEKVYSVQENGKLVSYSNTLASETLETTFGNGAGSKTASFGVYYNNYIYASGTEGNTSGAKADISRWGPLDATPAKVDEAWTGSTLGSQTALSSGYSGTYPFNLPKHAMHAHTDNKLYITDYADVNNAGKRGLIHFIKTREDTDPGDTDDGSTYGALDLPYNAFPVDIESYGDDLVIACLGTDKGSNPGGRAALYFWDTVSDSFYRVVYLPDAYVSAVLNHNGVLYIWTASNGGGYRVLRYLGGQSVEQIAFFEDGYGPWSGAVLGNGQRIVWGHGSTEPITSASVYSYGSKKTGLPSTALQCIATTTATASNTRVPAMMYHDATPSYQKDKFVIAHTDTSTNVGIEKLSTTYGNHVWRSLEYQIGAPFTIDEIVIPLAQSVAANMTIVPKLFFDRQNTSQALTTINNTNYAGSEIVIKIDPSEKTRGKNSFFLELVWSGTALATVSLPIIIKGTKGSNNTE